MAGWFGPTPELAQVRIEIGGAALVGQAVSCQARRLHIVGGRNWLTDAKTSEEIGLGNP